MQTRQVPRKPINLPARYFTGRGSAVDVVLSDLSVGGCRFHAPGSKLMRGLQLQMYVGSSGPHRATVRWIEDGEIGVTFLNPFTDQMIEKFKFSHVPGKLEDVTPGDFDPVPKSLPNRFC
uniref:PilZ domain-containing protein n=1 Tax=uncultured Erythrobacter sp. TaxID=263913 RepID=UPI0026277D4F|nr:PilZ domain-containing protein [uncultured Erythrobacter sp.]